MPEDTHLVVGVITYLRSEMLESCLSSLALQSTTVSSWSIVVVDNDPLASSRSVVEKIGLTCPVPIRYLVEPVPGIAAARNLVVKESRDVEYLAFIDDDEVAEVDWVEQLLHGLMRYHADVAQGEILVQLEYGGPGWVGRGSFFQRSSEPEGTILDTARTGNVIFRRAILGDFENPFRVDLGLTGGSDSELFSRLRMSGAKIVSVPSAKVTEFVPLSRQSRSWLVKRTVRTSAGRVGVLRSVIRPRFWRIQRLGAAGVRFLQGIGLTLWSGFGIFDQIRFVKGLQFLGFARGTMLGLLHRKVYEYGR